MLVNCHTNNIAKVQPLADALVNHATVHDTAVRLLSSPIKPYVNTVGMLSDGERRSDSRANGQQSTSTTYVQIDH
jgi:hypothetical protein